MSCKIDSQICLMLSVYKGFHQTVKYGRQRNHILQDLIGLETYISLKASELKTGFQSTSLSLYGIIAVT